MAIASLHIESFRCIEQADLTFDPRCTLIAGPNASGKTSILEAIHVLSSGRSFRTARPELLIKQGSARFLAVAQVLQADRRHTIGLARSPSEKEVHVNNARQHNFFDAARLLPVQIIDPGTHKLLEEGPALRRRYLDWGVFHVEPTFVASWRKFSRALEQRNAALRSQATAQLIQSWDTELATAGEHISELRGNYVRDIAEDVQAIAREILDVETSIQLRPGWEGTSLSTALTASWNADSRQRTTTVGPHRADLEIRIGSTRAKDVVSRGQQKLLACALILAQLRNRTRHELEPATLLLDDPAAELDVDNLGRLLRLLPTISAQLIITAVDAASVSTVLPAVKFHVERGMVTRML